MDDAIDEPEYVLCRRWREEVLELSRSELAALTGFSADVIKDYERADKKIDEKARRRYRLVVAAVTFGIEFDWDEVTFRPMVPITITAGRSRK